MWVFARVCPDPASRGGLTYPAVQAMSKFLQKVSRTLKLFNCFSYPKHGLAHNEPSTSALDHEQDNLTTADDESDTQRQEVGSNTLDKSSTTPIDLVFWSSLFGDFWVTFLTGDTGTHCTLCGRSNNSLW